MGAGRFVGFWKEGFPGGTELACLLEQSRFDWDRTELRGLVSYLERGAILVASPGVRHSIIDAREIAGSTSIRTDGLWIWPDTLSYYLRKAALPLPAEFRERARIWEYSPPPVDAETLATLIMPF